MGKGFIDFNTIELIDNKHPEFLTRWNAKLILVCILNKVTDGLKNI